MSREENKRAQALTDEVFRLRRENEQLKQIGADDYKHHGAKTIEGLFHMLEGAKRGSNPDIIMLARLQSTLRTILDSDFMELLVANPDTTIHRTETALDSERNKQIHVVGG